MPHNPALARVIPTTPVASPVWLDRDHLMALDFEPDVVGVASKPLSRLSSSVAGCFLGKLHPGREPEFGVDVGEVGLHGQLVVPMPPNKRADIQEPFIREQEVPPGDYYPEGYHPQLLSDWPADEDLVIPVEAMPQQMLAGMGRQRQAYKKHIDELTADS